MKKFVILFFIIFLFSIINADQNWVTDLSEALKKAEKTEKLVLVDFSGSDWCYWCKKLDKEVFSKKIFLDYAKKEFVLCMLDFPSDETIITKEQKEKNRKWAKKYKIRGYPTVLLMDSKGKVFYTTGYRPGGPEKYVSFLEKILKKYKEKKSK